MNTFLKETPPIEDPGCPRGGGLIVIIIYDVKLVQALSCNNISLIIQEVRYQEFL